MTDRLVDLNVSDFVEAVSSADQPVPAGGSVSALTGSTSAALVALVCEVLERHTPGAMTEPHKRSQALRRQLLELVDQDADAFRAFLAAERGSPEREAAKVRAVEVPAEIARACMSVVELAESVEPFARSAMRPDIGAAISLARAAAKSALGIAEHNLSALADSTTRETLRSRIEEAKALHGTR